VGNAGIGMLTIVNGAQVSNTVGSIGKAVNSLGFVTVDGTGSTWTNTGDVNVSTAGFATLTVRNGGTVSVGGLLSVGTLGTVRGNSTIAGNVQNGGLVVPSGSSSPEGALHINGNFTQTAAGNLQIEIGGTAAGSQYDQLLVTGSVALDGMLQVSLVNGFAPVAGNSFNILDFTSLSGTFGTVDLPTMNGRIVWDSSHLYDSGALGGTLSVVATYYAGDFNRDGHVNAADILLAMAALTDTPDYQTGHGLTDPTLFGMVADVNGDGSFNNGDLQALLDDLNSGGGSSDPVPEPASGLLAAGSMMLMLLRGRALLIRPRTSVDFCHRRSV
jgi:T5SS/PEP-CTERM-associated repeat protein